LRLSRENPVATKFAFSKFGLYRYGAGGGGGALARGWSADLVDVLKRRPGRAVTPTPRCHSIVVTWTTPVVIN
jgi:hypothetical protein